MENDLSAAEVLREELQVKTLTFSTIAKAFLWYAEQRGRKESARVPLELGRVPAPAFMREISNATYARIAACLTETAPEDYAFDPKIDDERLEALLLFYVTDGGASDWSQRNEAKFGMSWSKFCRECRRTRNVLKRRMQGRGVIE